jgi:hypothetical protein
MKVVYLAIEQAANNWQWRLEISDLNVGLLI